LMDLNEDGSLHLNPSLASGDFFLFLSPNLSATCCHGSVMSRGGTCSARQSPVDIDETFTQVRLQYQNVQLEGWNKLTAESTTIHNNGKTVAIDVDGEFFVSGGGLSSRFRVSRVTFHWGRCNATSDGSEHSLNGMKYPLEMQIYCYDPDDFQSLDDAIKEGGRVAALAVLFEVDALSQVVLLLGLFPGKSGSVEAFTLRSLLPNNTDKYYIYNGSLTAPPCSEMVEWIVFKHTVAISETQVGKYYHTQTHCQSCCLD
uniref:Alpha-carbonic anhydrase domain-containing protein n=1 Tax=Amphiprion percula TaxID=161767 RepID=A0A3P8U8M8_AMPPE